MAKTKSLTLVLLLYWVGIPAALLVALSGMYAVHNLVRGIPDLSSRLLVVGLGHMFLMVAVGAFVKRPENIIAGNKIQTAGYLHTLIGFAAALFKIDPGHFSIAAIMIPLGSALSTSIIGWFAGGEIAERGGTLDDIAAKGEMEKLIDELKGFAAAVRQVHAEYIRAMRKAKQSFEKLHDSQNHLLESALAGIKKLNSKFAELKNTAEDMTRTIKAGSEAMQKNLGDDFIDAIETVKTNSRLAAEELGKTAESAKDVAEYLGQARPLIEQMEKLMDAITAMDGKYAS